MANPVKNRKAAFLLRKNGCSENLVSCEANIFDMTAYVDLLRELLENDDFDYLIVEPIKFKDSLF